MYKVEIRKAQIKNSQGDNVIIICQNGVATYQPGTIANNQFEDVTADVVNPNSIEICYDLNEKRGRGRANEFVVTGDTFTKLRDTLYCSPCGHLEAFEVRIKDLSCKRELGTFLIKADNLQYCDDMGCELKVTLTILDEIYRCLDTTSMYDNHQGWFDGENTPSAETFPTFKVALQKDGAGAEVGVELFYLSFPLTAAANTILNSFGNAGIDVLDSNKTLRESLGFGNYATAPEIYRLFDNIAARCGITADTIFHTSPYNRDCWLEAPGGRYHKDDNNENVSDNQYFFQENTAFRTPLEWFEILELRYNGYWYIENNVLKFDLNKDISTQSLLDVSEDATDICYDITGEVKPGAYRLEYAVEDCASSNINKLYSNTADWDKGNNNQNLQGVERVSLGIASTGFVRDGTAADYTRLAMRQGLGAAFMMLLQLVLTLASLIAGLIIPGAVIAITASIALWTASLIKIYRDARRDHTNFFSSWTGAIRICNQDNISIPRIIRWDGVSKECAMAVRTLYPAPRQDCNSKGYNIVHSVNADAGNSSNNANNSGSYYAFNYPHYFDQNFTNNAYDEHEPTKNPNNNFEGNQSVSFAMCNDCDYLQALGVFNGQRPKLNSFVTIKNEECFGNKLRIKKIRLYQGYTYITGKIFRR